MIQHKLRRANPPKRKSMVGGVVKSVAGNIIDNIGWHVGFIEVNIAYQGREPDDDFVRLADALEGMAEGVGHFADFKRGRAKGSEAAYEVENDL